MRALTYAAITEQKKPAPLAPAPIRQAGAPLVHETGGLRRPPMLLNNVPTAQAKSVADFGYGDLVQAGLPSGSPSPASRETSGGKPLPAAVRDKMNGAFDFDFDPVRVHEGSSAAAIGAVAYTCGTEVHFAPGRYEPHSHQGQGLLAHELAHVVQQSDGRVAPTKQLGSIGCNDDAHLEQEADAWATRATRGETVSRGRAGLVASNAIQRKTIQRAPQTSHWGRFLDTSYAATADGAAILLEFEPGAQVDASKIGLTQSLKKVASGTPIVTDPQTAPRQVPSGGPGAGFEIDRIAGRNDPIYGSPQLSAGEGLSDTPNSNAPRGTAPSVAVNATYQLGFRYTDGAGLHTQNAQMYDSPQRAAAPNTGMEFETTALAIEGAQRGTYYGSVRWGWNRDASGTLSKIDFGLASEGVPSQNFLAAAAQWNTATAGGTLIARNAPTQLYSWARGAFAPSITIRQNTTVVSNGTVGAGAIEYVSVTVQSGPRNGVSGYVRATDLVDQNNGPATVDLPVPVVETLSSAQTLNDGVPGPWRDIQALPAGTRVLRTGRNPGLPPLGKVHVRVAAGPHTDAQGYVDGAALVSERP